jgi:hypothetical protein
MRLQCLLYRRNDVEVWPTVHIEGRGRLTTVYQIWCLATDCQDRGCLDTYRDPDQAIRFAGRHRHRLLPAYHHGARGYQRRRSA